MDFTTFKKHKKLFDDKSGLYLITHTLYPGYVKIGLGKPVFSRVVGYQTHIPQPDYRIHAVAVKPKARATYNDTNQIKTYVYFAEQRLLHLFRENRTTEWVKKDLKDVLKKMKELHFGSTEYKADGRGLPFYTFENNEMKKIEKKVVVSTRRSENNVIPIVVEKNNPRIRKHSQKVLLNIAN